MFHLGIKQGRGPRLPGPVGGLVAGVVLTAACAAASETPPAVADSLDVTQLLDAYNARIEATLESIARLTVRQEMIELQDDGSEHRETAILTYTAGEEMLREVVSSDLTYPSGEYRLESLVGPFISEDEYVVRFDGVEEHEGSECYLLSVEAVRRDSDHFDGRVWISIDDASVVRIVGEVADPPFPVTWIRLDKSFERHASGCRLLYRHTGEGEVSFIVARKKGKRHVFYEEYDVEFASGQGLDY